ncbi:MAG: DUF393 domain-containing protein [Pseudomonadota bacterium]
MTDDPEITVLYNSACPVCDAGIAAQRGKAMACRVDWRDVHRDPALVERNGLDLAFVRQRLHAVNAHGELKVGLDAFIAIWRNTPSERWKAAVASTPGLRPVLSVAYNAFAWGLYTWNRARKRW